MTKVSDLKPGDKFKIEYTYEGVDTWGGIHSIRRGNGSIVGISGDREVSDVVKAPWQPKLGSIVKHISNIGTEEIVAMLPAFDYCVVKWDKDNSIQAHRLEYVFPATT